MNSIYLQQLWQEKLFSDVTLILTDNHHEIKLDVHKSVLFISSTYFSKLLVGFREQHAKQISIHVSNATVAHDIIASFYGLTIISENPASWRYTLESIICCDYWGLEYDRFQINDLEIPTECFDEFVDMIDPLGYTDEIIKLIIRNLPQDYDLAKFPKELIRMMLELSSYDIIYGYINNSVSDCESAIEICNSSTHLAKKFTWEFQPCIIRNIYYVPATKLFASIHPYNVVLFDANGNYFDKISYPFYGSAKFILSPDGTNIIAMGHNYCRVFHNGKWYNLFFWSRACAFYPTAICYSTDSRQIAIGSMQGDVQIFDLQNIHEPKFVRKISDNNFRHTCLCYSPDSTELVCGHYNCEVKIWNVSDGNLLRVFTETVYPIDIYEICEIVYSPDGQLFAYSYDDTIMVRNASGGSIHVWNVGGLKCIAFSPNSLNIITGDINGNIMEWNLLDGSSVLINKVDDPIKCICTTSLTNYDKIRLFKKYTDTAI